MQPPHELAPLHAVVETKEEVAANVRRRALTESARLDVVHPLSPSAPELMESDRGAGSVLNFGEVRHV